MANKQRLITTDHSTTNKRCRIDKWLWAARFFKTRSLAQSAVEGGKVHIDELRCKPSKDVYVGAKISITKGEIQFNVIVTGLSQKRGNATEAAKLYQETEESLFNRQQAAEQRRLLRSTQPQFDHRPNKQERRQLAKFRKWQSDDKV